MDHVGSDQASPIFYFGRQMKDKKGTVWKWVNRYCPDDSWSSWQVMGGTATFRWDTWLPGGSVAFVSEIGRTCFFW